jgi:hypothetical protein
VLKGGDGGRQRRTNKTRKRFSHSNESEAHFFSGTVAGGEEEGRKRLNRMDDDVVCKSFCSIFGIRAAYVVRLV